MTKLTVQTRDFQAALTPLAGSTRHPMLGSSVTLEIGRSNLVLTASNFVTTVETECAYLGDAKPETVSVDYDKLTHLLEHAGDEVTLEATDRWLTVAGHALHATLPIVPITDTPAMPEVESWCQVEPQDLRRAITFLDHCAAPRTDGRENLKAIAFQIAADDTLRLSASDGTRGAYIGLPFTMPPLVPVALRTALVPAWNARDITRLLAGLSGLVELRCSDNTLQLVTDSAIWSTQLISQAFPDIKGIADQWRAMELREAVIDRRELADAIKTCLPFMIRSRADSYARVTIDANAESGMIAVSTKTDEGAATIEISGSAEQNFTVMANAKVLSEAVNAFESDELTVSVTHPHTGILLSSEGILGAQMVSPIVKA